MSISDQRGKIISMKEFKFCAQQVIKSKRFVNNIQDLLSYIAQLSNDEIGQSIVCFQGLQQIFTHYFSQGDLRSDDSDNNSSADLEAILLEQYENMWTLMMICFNQSIESAEVLDVAMDLIVVESKNMEQEASFPTKRLKSIIGMILKSSPESVDAKTTKFKSYCVYSDIIYFSWITLKNMIPKKTKPAPDYADNVAKFVSCIGVPENIEKLKCLCFQEGEFDFDMTAMREAMNVTWNMLMKCDMKEQNLKQILIVLIQVFFPYLNKPVLLTDFLMDSLNLGGAIGLLALQGVFILIQKHNLVHLNIFEQLYGMFNREVFYKKYRSRLFYLANIFLSSTHLPLSLVAAFVKRLARLSLEVQPQDIVLILKFVTNLILRHPGLKILLDAPENTTEIENDPFDMDEKDPGKSRALESSLWEVKALHSHVIPAVSQAAKSFTYNFPKMEYDIADELDRTNGDIYMEEFKKPPKDYGLKLESTKNIFVGADDKVHEYFDIL